MKKIVLWSSVLLLVTMVVFPPWVSLKPTSSSVAYSTPLGYYFIGSGPPFRGLNTKESISIDLIRLSLQALIPLIGFAFAMFSRQFDSGSGKRGPLKDTAPRTAPPSFGKSETTRTIFRSQFNPTQVVFGQVRPDEAQDKSDSHESKLGGGMYVLSLAFAAIVCYHQSTELSTDQNLWRLLGAWIGIHLISFGFSWLFFRRDEVTAKVGFFISALVLLVSSLATQSQ